MLLHQVSLKSRLRPSRLRSGLDRLPPLGICRALDLCLNKRVAHLHTNSRCDPCVQAPMDQRHAFRIQVLSIQRFNGPCAERSPSSAHVLLDGLHWRVIAENLRWL